MKNKHSEAKPPASRSHSQGPLYDQHARLGALPLKWATNTIIKLFSFSPAPLSSVDTRLNRPPSLCGPPERLANRDDLLGSWRSRVAAPALIQRDARRARHVCRKHWPDA